ncbi:MAG: autotransporter outer membrane beta-barrel domain-containing protein, partial [Burkholderiaceae bacterium]|nr:autotransporter outer membrane beta-barrel domain-containing protein [Burkholderiaceae bacterium]
GVSLGAGYSLLVSNFNLGPYVRVSSSKVKVDAFTEQANSSATHLAVQAQTAESVVSVLGGQIAYAISRNWGVLVPNIRFEWEHQYKDDRTSNVLANFSAVTSNPAIINIETTPPDRNYFNLGVGLASHFGVGRSAFIYYQTVLGKAETTNHAITAELRLEF